MNEVVSHYLDQHSSRQKSFVGEGLSWLKSQRQQGIEYFRQHGFPNQRQEDWRYTGLSPITRKRFRIDVDRQSTDVDISAHKITGLDSHQLVFVDGRLCEALSSNPDGVVATSWAKVLADNPDLVHASIQRHRALEHGFSALNIAFSTDGYLIQISDNIKLDRPLEIIFVASSGETTSQPRNAIHMGNFSEATVIERYVSADNVDGLINTTSQIELEAGARLNYHLIETHQSLAKQVTTVDVNQARDSHLTCCTVTLGGGLVRNNLKVSLNQPGAHCDMLGLYVVGGKEHVDNHTNVIHAAAHCTSRELYKGVLDQRSRAVFHGRITVARDAQKTDATQANNNLLLSKHAEIDTKPQLEIYADDVKCAHGATVGQIDETALFYLRARGIDAETARSLLTFAFVSDVLSEIDDAPLKEHLGSELGGRLISDG